MKDGTIRAGVLDTYSRKVIGWAMGKQHDAELVKEALQMALIGRQPRADLVHHSDRKSRICQHELSRNVASA
jgi:putative transposase